MTDEQTTDARNDSGSTDRTTTGPEAATKRKRTDISVILDRSGSMRARKQQAIDSFNDFLAEQRGVEGKAKISLVRFDHEYEPVFSGLALTDAPDLDERSYRPRGMTALLDAIGRTVAATEARLARRAERRKARGKAVKAPDVIVVVITDGLENASSEYDHADIKALIARLEQEHEWTFLFMGTSEASVTEAERFGVHKDRAFAMGETPEAYARAQRVVGGKVRTVREMNADAAMSLKRQALAFTEEEREAARQRDRS